MLGRKASLFIRENIKAITKESMFCNYRYEENHGYDLGA
jgi:hypothetical protein